MNTLICAIEFGSAHLSAIAARRDETGHITVLAVEQEASNGCIRHGNIRDIDAAAVKVKSLILKLNNRISTQSPTTIGKAYVGIAGISIHSMPHSPSCHLDDGDRITPETLETLRNYSRRTTLEGYDVIGVENSYYTLDERFCQNPLDQQCSEIIAHNQLIVARSYLKRHIQQTMERAGIEIAGYVALPLSTAVILQEIEKQQGCILVNFGAATTTVSIYKPTLQHLAVIPLGGDVVTNDIMSAGLSREKAENAKIQWSSAYPSGTDNCISGIDAIGIDHTLLNSIVQARIEEILANIKHQIEISGLDGELNGGFIITGEASSQKGLSTLLSQQFNWAVKTRTYTNPNITANGNERRVRYTSLLSMIALATIDCEKPRPVQQPIQPAQPYAQQPAQQPYRQPTYAQQNAPQAAQQPYAQHPAQQQNAPQQGQQTASQNDPRQANERHGNDNSRRGSLFQRVKEFSKDLFGQDE